MTGTENIKLMPGKRRINPITTGKKPLHQGVHTEREREREKEREREQMVEAMSSRIRKSVGV